MQNKWYILIKLILHKIQLPGWSTKVAELLGSSDDLFREKGQRGTKQRQGKGLVSVPYTKLGILLWMFPEWEMALRCYEMLNYLLMTTAFNSLTLWFKESHTFSSRGNPGINERTQDLWPADEPTLKSGRRVKRKRLKQVALCLKCIIAQDPEMSPCSHKAPQMNI